MRKLTVRGASEMDGPPILPDTVFTSRGPKNSLPAFTPVVIRGDAAIRLLSHSARDPRLWNRWGQPNRISFPDTLSDQLSAGPTDSSLAGAR